MCVLEMLTNDTPYRECVNVVQIYTTTAHAQGIHDKLLNQDDTARVSEQCWVRTVVIGRVVP